MRQRRLHATDAAAGLAAPAAGSDGLLHAPSERRAIAAHAVAKRVSGFLLSMGSPDVELRSPILCPLAPPHISFRDGGRAESHLESQPLEVERLDRAALGRHAKAAGIVAR